MDTTISARPVPRQRRARLALAGAVLTTSLGAAGLTSAAGVTPSITAEAVSFIVQNVNRSAVPCAADGRLYDLRGEIVAPTSALRPHSPKNAITVYLHGFGLAGDAWTFGAVDGYDFARDLAARGEVSLVVDRLGYATSGHPAGTDSCMGAQTDVAHQLVQALRAGAYTVLDGSGPPLSFARVALTGFSAGGAIAQAEAYSFRDVDALAVLAYADQDFSDRMGTTFSTALDVCAGGGQLSDGPGTPGGYAYFGQTDREYVAAVFFDSDPAVVRTATALRDRDPCGDDQSFSQAIGADRAGVGAIDVPVFLAYGANDALFLPSAGPDQRARYAASPDVTLLMLAGTGHLLMLERSAPQLRSQMAAWLNQHGV
jgi:alpha-beta hydrolase superfamily lysophospholipase